MQFGHFDDKTREYVIETPKTPYPWINYLGSEAFFGLISNTAGGYNFYKDARLRRITRYRYEDLKGTGHFHNQHPTICPSLCVCVCGLQFILLKTQNPLILIFLHNAIRSIDFYQMDLP